MKAINDKNLTKEQAESLFWHDKDTGDLYRHHDISPKLKKGVSIADVFNPYRATKDSHGKKYYVVALTIEGKKKMITAHRIIWNLYYGRIPENRVIDHIDNDPLNNRLENLQCITQSENIKRASKTDNQIASFEKHCRQPLKSGIGGIYTDGDKLYIKRRGNGSRRYCKNTEEALDYLHAEVPSF